MEKKLQLTDLVGEWSGLNRLWVFPGDPVRESNTNASVVLAARGALVSITYNWNYEGKPQEGILLVRTDPDPEDAVVVWFDSWHTGNQFMLFQRGEEQEGLLSVRGSYSAPPGPDWGWRIVLDSGNRDTFHILMYNITPDGEEALAVEARYTRIAPTQ